MSKRILIADDDTKIAHMLTETVGMEGYATFTTTQSLRFYDAVQEHMPHLVLLDFMMPYLDGYDELRLMKMNPATADIPVIIVTAYPEIRAREAELRQLGVVAILIKPLDIVALNDLIRKTIGEPQGVSR